jgi:hypothetical protein
MSSFMSSRIGLATNSSISLYILGELVKFNGRMLLAGGINFAPFRAELE